MKDAIAGQNVGLNFAGLKCAEVAPVQSAVAVVHGPELQRRFLGRFWVRAADTGSMLL